MHKQFEAEGLSIVGVTGESPEETVPWIERHKASYPYGYDRELLSFFSVEAIPFAVLVDTLGTIIWKGHPAALSPELIQIALRGALELPLYAWPTEAGQAKLALQERNYRKALRLSRGLDPRYGRMIQQRIDFHIASMKRASKRGDYLLAKELGIGILKACKQLPAHAEAEALLVEFKQSIPITEVLQLQLKLRDLSLLAAKTRERSSARKLLLEFEALGAAHPEDIVGTQAKREAAILRARIEGMR